MDRRHALNDLSGGNEDARRRAARVLGRWNDAEVADALIAALGDPDRGTREAASDTLLEIGDEDTVRKLVATLRDARPAPRNAARTIIGRLAKAAPEIVVALARDPDVRMRVFAANIIGESGDHDLALPLMDMLEDADENARDAAIVALGLLGAPEAVRGLERLAAAGSTWIRFSAIDALRQLRSSEAARALLRLLPEAPPELLETLADALRDVSPDAGLAREIEEGLAHRGGSGKDRS